MTVQITEKVLIYATWEARLVVFDEPDFPELLLQVPGGTIELGEAPCHAARREFTEETGLTFEREAQFLTTHDYHAVRDGRTIHHRRHFFHIPLETAPQKHCYTGNDIPPAAAILFYCAFR
ncbi:8-oxo-dGTP pyrophosphatase MutT (NUDIX family) [Agrobacterium vitis]|nr:8-oxo-dGTP pyrophosphatase MutT (NUDIX family) [Agrobacterium vitis]MBE1440505.1 8-oxo-dGTP pyrophosphatase MutT (NUDIX family) [Agrobacterium vitis]